MTHAYRSLKILRAMSTMLCLHTDEFRRTLRRHSSDIELQERTSCSCLELSTYGYEFREQFSFPRGCAKGRRNCVGSRRITCALLSEQILPAAGAGIFDAALVQILHANWTSALACIPGGEWSSPFSATIHSVECCERAVRRRMTRVDSRWNPALLVLVSVQRQPCASQGRRRSETNMCLNNTR
jgi:hypothetical protein